MLALVCLYVLATLALLPVAAGEGPEIPAITSLFAAGILVTDLSTAFLLFVWFREARTWALLLLGCAYLYGGSMAPFHLLTFPGAILPGRVVIGTPQSTAWIFLLWLGGYAALTLAALVLEASPVPRRIAQERAGLAVGLGAGAVLAAVLGSVLATTWAVGHLPPLMQGTSWTVMNRVLTWLFMLMLGAGIVLALAVVRERNPLFLWLGLALAAMLSAQILSIVGGGRYTFGWSAGRLNWVVAGCVLFLFFMGQFARQQHFLARSRDTLERRVAERTADLTRTVRQRDLLLREVYHRVKNNLQVVDALIAMERRNLTDAAARNALGALRSRVNTLGLVHQQLMVSDDLETFDAAVFLRELSNNVSAAGAAAERGIAVAVEAESVPVTLDFAIPVGLITTELVSDAMKRAHTKRIFIRFRRINEKNAMLVVEDNGESVAQRDTELASDIRLAGNIVVGLIGQLDGQMSIVQREGTRIEIRMPLPIRP